MVSIYTGDNQEWLSQQIGDLLQSVAHEATGKSHPEVLDETVHRVVETLWSKMESMAYAIEYLSRGREDLEVFPEHLKTSGRHVPLVGHRERGGKVRASQPMCWGGYCKTDCGRSFAACP